MKTYKYQEEIQARVINVCQGTVVLGVNTCFVCINSDEEGRRFKSRWWLNIDRFSFFLLWNRLKKGDCYEIKLECLETAGLLETTTMRQSKEEGSYSNQPSSRGNYRHLLLRDRTGKCFEIAIYHCLQYINVWEMINIGFRWPEKRGFPLWGPTLQKKKKKKVINVLFFAYTNNFIRNSFISLVVLFVNRHACSHMYT